MDYRNEQFHLLQHSGSYPTDEHHRRRRHHALPQYAMLTTMTTNMAVKAVGLACLTLNYASALFLFFVFFFLDLFLRTQKYSKF